MTHKILALTFAIGLLILGVVYYFFDGTPVHSILFTDGNATSVTRVIDGDTFEINGEKIRLIGIDYPDITSNRIGKWEDMGIPRQQIIACYADGSQALKELLSNISVTLEIDPNEQDKDQYGRLLRYVKLSTGTYVEEWLLERGYAVMYDPTKPMCAKCKDWLHIESNARERKIGCLWRNPITD